MFHKSISIVYKQLLKCPLFFFPIFINASLFQRTPSESICSLETMNMTQKRNSRIALLAVAMLLSGALLGLISEDSSAAENNAVGYISSTDSSGVSVTYINQATGATASVTSLGDGSYSFGNLVDGEYSVRYSKQKIISPLL